MTPECERTEKFVNLSEIRMLEYICNNFHTSSALYICNVEKNCLPNTIEDTFMPLRKLSVLKPFFFCITTGRFSFYCAVSMYRK